MTRWGLGLCFAVAACASAPDEIGSLSDYIIVSPSKVEQPLGWAIFAPGASGLSTFDGYRHYHRTAVDWNEACFDVIMVDYDGLYAAFDRPNVGETGDRVLWAIRQALTSSEARPALRGELGVFVGWSSGGEGVWAMGARPGEAARLGFDAAILYYPTNEDGFEYKTEIPTDMHVGAADNVVSPRELVWAATTSDRLTAFVYDDANHGFDIEGLSEQRANRFVPFGEPRAIMEYNEKAAQEADEQVAAFLATLAGSCGAVGFGHLAGQGG